jgi:uncharacterized protein YciW
MTSIKFILPEKATKNNTALQDIVYQRKYFSTPQDSNNESVKHINNVGFDIIF